MPTGHKLSEAGNLPCPIWVEGPLQPWPGSPHHAAVCLRLPLPESSLQPATQEGRNHHAHGRYKQLCCYLGVQDYHIVVMILWLLLDNLSSFTVCTHLADKCASHVMDQCTIFNHVHVHVCVEYSSQWKVVMTISLPLCLFHCSHFNSSQGHQKCYPFVWRSYQTKQVCTHLPLSPPLFSFSLTFILPCSPRPPVPPSSLSTHNWQYPLNILFSS